MAASPEQATTKDANSSKDDSDDSLSHSDEISDNEDELLMSYAEVISAAIPKYQKVRSRTITNSKAPGNIQLASVHQSSEHKAKPPLHPARTKPPVSQRRQDNVIQGKGTAPGLRAVNNSHSNNATSNRSCTGVFVTRMQPRTTVSNMETYLRRETGLSVSVEKLNTKFNTYSFFYIPCNSHMRTTLLNENVWPHGALIKPFFN